MTTYAGMNAPVAVKILLAVMTSLLFLVRFSQSIISNKTSEKMMYFNLMTRRENSLADILDRAYTHFVYICVPEDCIYTHEDTSLLGSGFVAHRLNEKGRKYFQEKYSKILPVLDIDHCDYTLRAVNKAVILNNAIYKSETSFRPAKI